MMATKPISEADLQAYIDGQLDMRGRIEIERRLQAEPIAAARVMEELRLRDEPRLFMIDEAGPAPPATVALARDLSRRLRARSNRRRLRRATAAAVLIGAGWLAHAEFGFIVDQVAAAHPIPTPQPRPPRPSTCCRSVLRLRNAAPFIGHATQGGEVPIPPLGGDVHLVRAELAPTGDGPTLVSLYRFGDGALVSFLAAEAASFAVTWPQSAAVNGRPTVFWQTGPFAYAVSGDIPEAELLGDRPPSGARSLATIQLPSPTEGTPMAEPFTELTRQPAGRAKSS